MATDVIVLDAVESMAEDIDTTLDEKLDPFIDEATAIVEKLGTGLPPRDMIAFTSQSTDEGIKLTFTPPDVTYFVEHTSGDGKQFACMPAGVLIRYSDVGYPRTPNDGMFGYDYKPTGDWDTESHECTIVGLTKDTKYYFTAFPYSTEHVYNKNQIAANRTEMTWVGNKGTISVTVNTPEGYQGALGEYTITLVDQAAESPQNVEQTANGQGLTRFGNLEGGKTYKVRLSTTSDLQAPADSEPITIVGGMNYDVTMTYVSRYGTLTVNVSTQPAGMPIGAYTVTLTPQGGGEAKRVQGNNSQAVVFSDVENGKVYTVSLSAINHYTANAGGTVTAVGGQNTQHNANYVFTAKLSDLTWLEINELSEGGHASKVFSVGDQKTFKYKGSTTITCEVIGLNKDKKESGGYAGITFGVKSGITEYLSNEITSSYFSSDINTETLNYTILNNIELDLRSVIKNVYKTVTSNSYLGEVLDNPATTESDYVSLFLFSVTELFGTGVHDMFEDGEGKYYDDGSQYPIFTTSQSRSRGEYYLLRTMGVPLSDYGNKAISIWCYPNGDGFMYHHSGVSQPAIFGFCV